MIEKVFLNDFLENSYDVKKLTAKESSLKSNTFTKVL